MWPPGAVGGAATAIPLFGVGLALLILAVGAPSSALGGMDPADPILARANAGDADAQFRLGNVFMSGRGQPSDPAEAVRWYRMAAAQGHALAQCALGCAFRDGSGVTRDRQSAIYWLQLSAMTGHAAAQRELGLLYLDDRRHDAHPAEAVRCLRAAAARDDRDAQLRLADLFAGGGPVLQDDVQALHLFQLASDSRAATRLEARMTPAQIAAADALTRAWQRQTPDAVAFCATPPLPLGLSASLRRLERIPTDSAEAAAVASAAAQGMIEAQFRVGLTLFRRTPARPGDRARGLRILLRLADGGYPPACLAVSRALSDRSLRWPPRVVPPHGATLEPPPDGGAPWLARVLATGYAPAQLAFARDWRHGRYRRRSLVEAAHWLRKAAAQGLDEAQSALARCYRDGEGVPRSLVLAHQWANLAGDRRLLAELDRLMSAEQRAAAQQLARAWQPIDATASAALPGDASPLERIAAPAADARWWLRVREPRELAALRQAAATSATAAYELGVACYAGPGASDDPWVGRRWWQKAADRGNASAQVMLGCLLEHDRDENRHARALALYLAAARAGSSEALDAAVGAADRLLRAYHGQGPADPDLVWLQAEAERGNARAQFVVGTLAYRYAAPRGIMRGDPVLPRWFILAAHQGVAGAQAQLGAFYEDGHLFPRDLGQAYAWTSLAAAVDWRWSRSRLRQLAAKMSPAELEGGQRLAATLFASCGALLPAHRELRERAERGEVAAQLAFADLLAEGGAVPPNDTERERWLRRAAEAGSVEGIARLGEVAYERWRAATTGSATHTVAPGIDHAPDGAAASADEAITWLTRAAGQGSARSAWLLALLFDARRSGAADLSSAARWRLQAAELGDLDAQFDLAGRTAMGAGVPRDPIQAYVWYCLGSIDDPKRIQVVDAYERLLSRADIERGQALAAAWRPRSAPPTPDH